MYSDQQQNSRLSGSHQYKQQRGGEAEQARDDGSRLDQDRDHQLNEMNDESLALAQNDPVSELYIWGSKCRI